jgi:[ribosomal protein S5]-alanine N-acetyltransferase
LNPLYFPVDGIATERVRLVAAMQADVADLLSRIMANHRPENTRSANLLAKLGFEREGLARAYLRINGAWADHVLTSLINASEGAGAQ